MHDTIFTYFIIPGVDAVVVKSMRLTTIRCPLSASTVHGRDSSPHLLPGVSEFCRVLPKSTMC